MGAAADGGSSTKKRKHTTDAAAESKALKKEGAPADVKAAKKAAKKKALAAGATDAEAKAAGKAAAKAARKAVVAATAAVVTVKGGASEEDAAYRAKLQITAGDLGDAGRRGLDWLRYTYASQQSGEAGAAFLPRLFARHSQRHIFANQRLHLSQQALVH